MKEFFYERIGEEVCRERLANGLEVCAAKVEEAIKKIDGVHGASVSFMTQKLTLDADDARYDEILQQVITTAKKIEPDCELHLK